MTDDNEPMLYIIPKNLLDAVSLAMLHASTGVPNGYKLLQQLAHAEPISATRYENTYQCDDCNAEWQETWCSDTIESDCEICGRRHLSPIESVELQPIDYHRRHVDDSE